VVYTYIASQLYSNKDKEVLLKAFKEIDRDGDGVIERDELMTIYNDSNTTLQAEEVERILQIIDTNGSGRIDFTEFLVAASNEEQLLKKKQLESAFSYLDTDHSGFITFEEIQSFLDGTEQTNEEIRQIFR
jgi:calcium-dependent protein kinase